MATLFLQLLNMSITASWIVLAVALFRLIFKKAPKFLNCIMWAFVGIRLVCPFTLESVLSLIPSAEPIPKDILVADTPAINSGLPFLNQAVNPILGESLAATPYYSMNPMQGVTFIASVIWSAGIIIMLLYTVISYLHIHRKVREAIPFQENIWLCDRISTPFIFGVFRPRIYLPSHLNKQDTKYVIAHEQAHLKRHDHLWKPLAFLLLVVYWFNPILWITYILLCRDIELACDEKVVKDMGAEIKKPYSAALINCSVPRRMIAACPLAFGEVGVKSRIKSVLNYKKPAIWIVVVSIAACLVTAACFLTNPHKTKLKNIEQLALESTFENTVAMMVGNGETYQGVQSVNTDLLIELGNIEISSSEVSTNRSSEDRDKTNTLILQTEQDIDRLSIYSYRKGTYICFSSDFSQVWVYDGVKPTSSYRVIHPAKAKEIFESLCPDMINSSTSDPYGTIYSYSHKAENDTAYLSLSPENQSFSFSFSLLSSYAATGTYEEDHSYIILNTDDGKNKYTFKRDGDHLIFIADQSSAMPKFKYSASATEAIVCLPDQAIFEFNDSFQNYISKTSADIDADGVIEDCIIGYGPTSGIFTFTFSAYEKGELEYFNIFNSQYQNLTFAEGADGSMKLRCEALGNNPVIRYFDINIEGENIELSTEDEKIPYWGEQGIHSQFAK